MKVFGRLMLVLAWAAGMGGIAHAGTYQRQPGISIEHYVFNVEVSDNTHLIKGETVATVRFTTADVDRVVFDLKARGNQDTGMVVESVADARTGEAVEFVHQGEELTLHLKIAPQAGESREFRVTYAGKPADGLTFGTSRQGDRVFVVQNWPTKMRDWVPTVDNPSSKATSEWVVTAPEKYSVVANGALVSEISLGDGRKVTHWKEDVPIASWLNAFLVARFQTWYGGPVRGIPLQIWAPVGAKVNVENGFLVAGRAIDYFGDLVGPYPFEKLAQVAAPFLGGGGMENANVIFYAEGGKRDGSDIPARGLSNEVAMSLDAVMAHEIAHQWFGNSVTEARWGDVWLSESFASYFADLYVEHFEGREAFVARLKTERTQALTAEQKERKPVLAREDDTQGPDLLFVQYVKGSWVLHMLRELLTTPVFFRGIHLYYERYQGGSATTDDLRHAMEDASGQKLEWFFDQWLTRWESPKLDVKWSYNSSTKALRLSVVQKQPGEAYRLPLAIGVADSVRGEHTVLKVDVDRKAQSFTLPLAKPPAEVVLDPNTELLAEVAFTGEPR